jgi:hypothetical protein
MNPSFLNKIIDKINKLAIEANDSLTRNQVGKNDDYRELVSVLEKEWGDKFSYQSIERRILALVQGAIPDNREVTEKALKDVNNYYCNYNSKQTIYIPVHGIKILDINSLKIGKVTFELITDRKLEDILLAMEISLKSMAYTDTEKEYLIKENRDKFVKILEGKVCSIYQVIAEPDRAIELAESETRRSLEILRYSIHAIHPAENMRVGIGLADETLVGKQDALALSDLGFHDSWKRLSFPLEVSPQSEVKLRQIGVFKLSEILMKPHKNEFELSLLRFLHWISDSYMHTEPENQLLSLMVGLETVFGSGANGIGFGVAIIVEKELDSRKNMKQEILRLYNLRNKVVHGSKSCNVTNTDIFSLRGIVVKLMVSLLGILEEKKINRKEDLKILVEEGQLS